ncbi:hypothetical protein [Mycolicibacterium houstonense]|uniref:hypothetical protein n=1 Tax=Mycolicibacterium houstonense TaxID=146021 RepID=UPI0008310051|nr:hypothetical protein [Mycolicibacterium houstonense]
MSGRLLASAPTVEAIQAVVRRFWMSDQWQVDPVTLELSHPDRDPAKPIMARVVKQGRRYRFEAIR